MLKILYRKQDGPEGKETALNQFCCGIMQIMFTTDKQIPTAENTRWETLPSLMDADGSLCSTILEEKKQRAQAVTGATQTEQEKHFRMMRKMQKQQYHLDRKSTRLNSSH